MPKKRRRPWTDGDASSYPMPNSASSQETTPIVGRLLRLIVGLIVIWLIVFVLAPLPFQYSDTLRGLKEAADAYGIHPGSVYYTDVPISGRAENNSREAVRAAHETREVPRADGLPPSERQEKGTAPTTR